MSSHGDIEAKMAALETNIKKLEAYVATNRNNINKNKNAVTTLLKRIPQKIDKTMKAIFSFITKKDEHTRIN